MTFIPDKDIPSLTGKVIAITGGTDGLGSGSAIELAKHQPAHIIITGRNAKKADDVKAKISQIRPDLKVTFIQFDVSSLDSVREGAKKIEEATDRLDILMLNAGIMATPPAVSKDGYEMQFATNFLGHALLAELLLPLLDKTAKLPGADVRVLSITTIAYKQAPSNGIDFASLKTDQAKLGGLGSIMATWRRYGQSKLAQLLYTQELAQHHPEITWVSIHPGIIMTNLFGQVPLLTKLPPLIQFFGRYTPVKEGHYAQVWAATCDKSKLKNGEYYEPIGQADKGDKTTHNNKLASELWDWTQKEISSHKSVAVA